MTSPIFASFTLRLRTEKPFDALPSGEALHGLAFRYIKTADPDLATIIHDLNHKPFTLSLLRRPKLTPNTYLWSWTILDFDLYHKVSTVFYREWANKKVRTLNAIDFVIDDLYLDGSRGSELITPDDLLVRTKIFHENSDGRPHFGFRLLTPTAFKHADSIIWLFPEPRVVWTGLARRLIHFCPQFSDYCSDNIDFENLMTCEYRLRTVQLEFRNLPMKGIKGDIVYLPIKSWSRDQIFAASLIYQAAPFLGIGAKTAQGMGTVSHSLRKPRQEVDLIISP